MRSGRPRGPGTAFKSVGGDGPNIFDGVPGLPGPSRLRKCIQKDPWVPAMGPPRNTYWAVGRRRAGDQAGLIR